MKEMTAREAIRELGISLDCLYRALWSGRYSSRKDGQGRILIPATEIQRWKTKRLQKTSA